MPSGWRTILSLSCLAGVWNKPIKQPLFAHVLYIEIGAHALGMYVTRNPSLADGGRHPDGLRVLPASSRICRSIPHRGLEIRPLPLWQVIRRR